MRLLTLLAFGFLAGLVILIYEMKFETRRLENQAAELVRAIEDERDNVALMKAEWSHVTRPDRVEKLARDVLQLAPAKGDQLIYQRDFLELLARRPVPKRDDETAWQARDEIGALIRNNGVGDGNGPSSPAQ